ncbi:MAG: tRNA (adenosine(37)-N6)-threonylcarbamoyltransferase complex ATPase subunit type 1 TsaE [Saprospirales bacterium]|nr:MAG: tRNA (adenosine(37)-N6)-threonylcarbamoyltransferase complex ATPase subunit type 1 TsaE [Saprospirales bacterium]
MEKVIFAKMKNQEEVQYQFEVKDLSGMDRVAARVIEALGEPGIVLLEGEMGAGKTTLVNKLCRHLGVIDTVNSPTFALVNIYLDQNDRKIFHLDLYRLESTEEFLEAGMEDYVTHNYWTFIEWPELAIPFAEGNIYRVKISATDTGKRKITIFSKKD